ncbi:MAG: SAM-dependent methyltransferase, partial [Haemophilus parainfluenzae]
MIINDINFNDLYQQHLKACNHYNLPATKWDKKAPKMAENLVGKASRYNDTLIKAM